MFPVFILDVCGNGFRITFSVSYLLWFLKFMALLKSPVLWCDFYKIGMKPSLPYVFIIIICRVTIGASNLYCTSSLQPNGVVLIDSDIWISQFHNTEYSCSQHGLATPWLMLEWQGICQKHLLWTEFIVYCHVMLGSFIKWRGQSIKQGRLHAVLHFAPLFKCDWSIL